MWRRGWFRQGCATAGGTDPGHDETGLPLLSMRQAAVRPATNDDDFAALAEVFQSHERSLRALAFRFLADANDVDDVLQEAYVRAHRGLHRFDGGAALSSWVYRIVQTTCIDELRRRRPTEELGEHPCPASDPAECVARRVDLDAALGALGAGERAVLVLAGLGFDYETASEVLVLPKGTVASRIHRGRIALRRSLAEQAA